MKQRNVLTIILFLVEYEREFRRENRLYLFNEITLNGSHIQEISYRSWNIHLAYSLVIVSSDPYKIHSKDAHAKWDTLETRRVYLKEFNSVDETIDGAKSIYRQIFLNFRYGYPK